MLKPPSPNVTAKTHTVYVSYKGAYGPAVLHGNSLFKLTLAVKETKLYKTLTYVHMKVQDQGPCCSWTSKAWGYTCLECISHTLSVITVR